MLRLRAELARRTTKLRSLESALAAAKAAPMTAQLALGAMAGEIAATFERLREGLVGAPHDMRQAMRALFARLSFEPDGNHWAVAGSPRIELPATSPAFATPEGFEPSSLA
jgi:hypothetical protein